MKKMKENQQMNRVIHVEKVSKHYQLHRIRKDRFIDLFNFRKQEKETFIAVRELELDVYAGEVIGITGRNGSGKSTLIKLLAGVTRPTSGIIQIDGSVAPLLEVGTGFHQDLTGYENIFLNGSILGMNRRMIRAKINDIIAFSELTDFIHVPIKKYSTGMEMRLAFSIAIHLDTDIILLDEVLAVGDANFRSKCLQKIKELSNSNKTILIVSHQLDILEELADKIITMERGEIQETQYLNAPL